MPAENLEVVRRWLAAMSGSREEALAAIPELWDEKGQHHPVRKFPDARPSHSRQEFSDWFDRFLEAFSLSDWAINDLIPVGEDRVLACVVLRAKGRESGLGIEGELYQCYWLRHGRIVRLEDHMTLRGALQGLGLEGATLEETGLGNGPSGRYEEG